VFVQGCLDLVRLGQLGTGRRRLLLHLLTNDVVAQFDTFVADEYRRAGNQFAHLVLALAAKGAIEQLAAVVSAFVSVGHDLPSTRGVKTVIHTMPVFMAGPQATVPSLPARTAGCCGGWTGRGLHGSSGV